MIPIIAVAAIGFLISACTSKDDRKTDSDPTSTLLPEDTLPLKPATSLDLAKRGSLEVVTKDFFDPRIESKRLAPLSVYAHSIFCKAHGFDFSYPPEYTPIDEGETVIHLDPAECFSEYAIQLVGYTYESSPQIKVKTSQIEEDTKLNSRWGPTMAIGFLTCGKVYRSGETPPSMGDTPDYLLIEGARATLISPPFSENVPIQINSSESLPEGPWDISLLGLDFFAGYTRNTPWRDNLVKALGGDPVLDEESIYLNTYGDKIAQAFLLGKMLDSENSRVGTGKDQQEIGLWGLNRFHKVPLEGNAPTKKNCSELIELGGYYLYGPHIIHGNQAKYFETFSAN